MQPTNIAHLPATLARLDPGELLIPERVAETPAFYELFAEWKPRLTLQPGSRFDSENARRRLLSAYQVGTLDAFGDFTRCRNCRRRGR